MIFNSDNEDGVGLRVVGSFIDIDSAVRDIMEREAFSFYCKYRIQWTIDRHRCSKNISTDWWFGL